MLLVFGVTSSGFGGLLIMAGLIGLITATYTLVTGRRSWALIPSRPIAAIAVAGALVLTMVGGGVSGATQKDLASTTTGEGVVRAIDESGPATASEAPSSTPTEAAAAVAFTDDAPADPDSAKAAPDAATVVITDSSDTDSTALALLETLPVKGRAPKTGYARTTMFGSAWLDVDRNGCDTRNDILNRDLRAVTKSGACKVLTGTLADPYTGKVMSFMRGNTTSALVQIDHVVALSNAWQTGAQKLSQAQRISLANDPLNLLAVDGRANAQKSDGDAATWLPAYKAFRCAYVSRQVSVKATYGLWVTPAEHDAIGRVLTSCTNERALTSAFAPAPAPKPAPAPSPAKPAPIVVAPVPVAPKPIPAPAPKPAPAPAPEAYYANCTAVRAAGKAPIYRGQPGYAKKLDRDGDGVGCE